MTNNEPTFECFIRYPAGIVTIDDFQFYPLEVQVAPRGTKEGEKVCLVAS